MRKGSRLQQQVSECCRTQHIIGHYWQTRGTPQSPDLDFKLHLSPDDFGCKWIFITPYVV